MLIEYVPTDHIWAKALLAFGSGLGVAERVAKDGAARDAGVGQDGAVRGVDSKEWRSKASNGNLDGNRWELYSDSGGNHFK